MPVKTYSLKSDGSKKLSTNFTVKEFKCNDGSDEILIDSELVELLQKIRNFFGKAVTITSGYRTSTYNTKVGGTSNSYHVKGQAADIVVSGITAKRVAQYAEAIGALGVGWYENKKFTHIDTRTSKYFWKDSSGNSKSTFAECTYTEPTSNLSSGSSGTGVKWLQWHLSKVGNSLTIDGKFGTKTQAALLAFQKGQKLTADGICGTKTRAALKIAVI